MTATSNMCGTRDVEVVISISLNNMFVCVCVCVCVVSSEFSLDGNYMWDAGCNKSNQHQPELHVCVW